MTSEEMKTSSGFENSPLAASYLLPTTAKAARREEKRTKTLYKAHAEAEASMLAVLTYNLSLETLSHAERGKWRERNDL